MIRYVHSVVSTRLWASSDPADNTITVFISSADCLIDLMIEKHDLRFVFTSCGNFGWIGKKVLKEI